jgi:hypothetical protein
MLTLDGESAEGQRWKGRANGPMTIDVSVAATSILFGISYTYKKNHQLFRPKMAGKISRF